MSQPRLLLLGAGGHARSSVDVIECEGRFEIAGLVGLRSEVGSRMDDYRIVGADEDLLELRELAEFALVTLGQIETPDHRMRLFQNLLDAEYRPATVVSPSAQVSSRATIGSGSIILHGAIVNAGAVVGCNVIVNSRALIEHDALVGDHCHVATAAVLNGGAELGEGTFLGSAACVREGVVIGQRSLVGMCASVRHDLEAGTRFPAVKGGPA